jgi:hypothetical protein
MRGGKAFFAQGSKRALVAAVLLAIIAAYTVVVVLIAVTSGRSHAAVFWPTVVLMTILSVWVAHRALRLWRRAKGVGSGRAGDAS